MEKPEPKKTWAQRHEKEAGIVTVIAFLAYCATVVGENVVRLRMRRKAKSELRSKLMAATSEEEVRQALQEAAAVGALTKDERTIIASLYAGSKLDESKEK